MSKTKVTIKSNFMNSRLKKLKKISPILFQKAQEVAALQLLTWSNTGTGKTSKKPPIRFGILRGSSSVFVGSKLVSIFNAPVSEGQITPAKSHSGKKNTITIVWNTDYASKMHEWKGDWGPFTQRDQDAGNKWATENLKANKNLLMEVIAREFRKGLNKE